MRLDVVLQTPAIFMVVLLTSAAPFVAAHSNDSTRFVVGFEHNLSEKAKRAKLDGEETLRMDDALGFAIVNAHDAAAFEARMRADPQVRYVSVDAPDAVRAEATPSDPYFAQQYAYARMNASSAWDVTTGSASVIVAVLDTGVDHSHPDLAGARLLQGYNFVANSADTSDACGHGTHVAGIVGATANNGIGVAGAAQVTILPVKVMDKDSTGSCVGPFSAVASGIRYATDQGARVISMSLGCAGCYDQATEDAIQYALSRNVLLVAAAGNSGPCSDCVAWPAADAGVVAVACSDQYDAQCSFSSAGPQVELTAPGKNVYSTVPGGYMSMSGTSMSTPAVAGAAALAFSAAPSLTGSQVRQLMDSTARDVGAAGLDQAFGHGIVDYGKLVQAAKGVPASAPVNAPPTASFSWSASGLTASVDGSASKDSDGSVASYAWTFGDGATATGATASHAYAAGGSYPVTLTVTDNAGATASTTQTITVTAPAPAPKDHVGAMQGASSATRNSMKISWSVPVLDSAGAGVASATVSATLSSPSGSSSLSATTASNGVASFGLAQKKLASGTYTLCVSNVAKSGWTYDPAANVMTCQSVTI